MTEYILRVRGANAMKQASELAEEVRIFANDINEDIAIKISSTKPYRKINSNKRRCYGVVEGIVTITIAATAAAVAAPLVSAISKAILMTVERGGEVSMEARLGDSTGKISMKSAQSKAHRNLGGEKIRRF